MSSVIHVKTPSGKFITMEVQDTDTIRSIKEKISEIHGIPHDRQKIEFFDKRAYFKSCDVSDIHKLEDAKLAGTCDSAKALIRKSETKKKLGEETTRIKRRFNE
ncbi:ubiquitin-60S ribosomal protein L40 [Trifolium repens]|nr:ubiquitin-60S ribosomal protein L40 [Trifolium repens]